MNLNVYVYTLYGIVQLVSFFQSIVLFLFLG